MFKISKEFIDNFNLCLNYYGCTKEEANFEKERIKRSALDYYRADRCYSAIAAEIRNQNTGKSGR